MFTSNTYDKFVTLIPDPLQHNGGDHPIDRQKMKLENVRRIFSALTLFVKLMGLKSGSFLIFRGLHITSLGQYRSHILWIVLVRIEEGKLLIISTLQSPLTTTL